MVIVMLSLYHLENRVNDLARKARNNPSAKLWLSDMLCNLDVNGYSISTDKTTGYITVTRKKELVNC